MILKKRKKGGDSDEENKKDQESYNLSFTTQFHSNLLQKLHPFENTHHFSHIRIYQMLAHESNKESDAPTRYRETGLSSFRNRTLRFCRFWR
jgi:hypothetical protein